jgi:hypothetical protein
MNACYLSGFSGESERLWRDAEQTCGLVQIEPWLYSIHRWPEDRDLVIRPERGHSLAGPAIAVAGHQTVSIEDAGNQIIIGDEHQLPDGRDDIGVRTQAFG